MKITKKTFILLVCALTAMPYACTASEGQDLFISKESEKKLDALFATRQHEKTTPPSALEAALPEEKEILDAFNKGDDKNTKKAAKLALLLIANSPVKIAQRDVAHNAQLCKDGKELMIIGASIFAFFHSWNLFDVPAASYYSDIRSNGIIIGNTLGSLALLAGYLKYQYGAYHQGRAALPSTKS